MKIYDVFIKPFFEILSGFMHFPHFNMASGVSKNLSSYWFKNVNWIFVKSASKKVTA
jgi:hypothetical protein